MGGGTEIIDVEAYLDRIGYRGSLEPTVATLAALHEVHLLSVPFENLDILERHPLYLDVPLLFNKIVRRHRGGICYEINGLFMALLRQLGFEVAMLAARDVGADGSLGPPFDHLALLVEVEGRWLVDIGWGDQFVRPLRLDTDNPQSDGRRLYRIAPHDGAYIVKRFFGVGDEDPMYRLTLTPYALADFEDACVYHQTAPAAPFAQRMLCTRLTKTGRITVSGDRVIETIGEKRHEYPLVDRHAQDMALRQYFGLTRNE